MTDVGAVTVPLAVLAGVVSFASPCFLPLVPVFVGYITGTGPSTGVGRADRRAVLGQSMVFVLGFTAVFVAMWASIGLLGHVAGDHRDTLRIAGGAVLVLLGLHVAGLVRLPLLDRQIRPRMDVGGAAQPTYRRSALLGAAFAAGWTPCIGPILGAVLGFAMAGESIGQGVVLLLAYSIGHGLPFVLVALGADAVRQRLTWLTRHHTAVQLCTGALLGITGFLMITDHFGRLAGLVPAPIL